ncbi:MAG: glycosyltransferase, partial [Clostridia bacterium]|nr:glycosyltransferase [Clostridia bacterium]
MSQTKLVSVTINAYNCEKYIAQTLESVINQSYKNLQIIVIDDASTDNTANVIKCFDDPRIELYTLEKNGHISNAINEGYRRVRGEYMVHIDSDDIMLPDLIEKTVEFLENNAEYGAVFHRPTIIDQNGNDVRDEFLENVFNTPAKTQTDFVRLFFDSSNHLLHPGSTMRKNVMDDIGFHNMSLCYLHDFDYWTRLVLKYPIYVFEQPLIKYRMDTSGAHNSDLSEQKTLAHNTEYARVIYNMIDNCPDEIFMQAFADKLILKG